MSRVFNISGTDWIAVEYDAATYETVAVAKAVREPRLLIHSPRKTGDYPSI